MSNEITIRLKCNIDEICRILEDKDFILVEKYLLDDTYYILQNLNIKEMTIREILSNAIILRDIVGKFPKYNETKFTHKNKEIDKCGNIIKQNKIDCSILKLEDGKKFLKAINYKEILHIKENDIVYEKEGFQISIKEILNGENLIEIEENEKFDTIDKIKQKLNELEIPKDKIDTSNYFVKKAEIELKKIL